MESPQLSSMFELFPIGTYRSSPDGRMLRANSALVKLNGYESEEALIRHFNDVARQWYVDPSRREEFLQRIERDGHVVDFVSEIHRHRTRERIWVKENAHLVRDAQGQVLCFEGTVEDITESRATRLALQQSEAQLRLVTAQVPGMVYRMEFPAGPPGHYTFISAGVQQLFGVTPEAAMRDDASVLHRMTHPDDHDWVVQRLSDAVASREQMVLEFRILLADGTLKWVEMTSSADVDGPVQGRTGVIIDISSRKRAEQARQQSLDLLTKISAQVPGVLFQLKMDDQGQFSLPYASQAGLELFGVTLAAVRADTCRLFEVVVDADRAAFVASIQHSARTMQDWSGEFRVALQGQGIRWRLGQARPERLADGSTLWHGYIADATEHIEAQRALHELNTTLERRVQERTQELAQALDSAERANRSRGEFLANTSHEIRTPMNSVLGMAYLALKSATDARQREYLEKIQSAGAHLMRIIDDILDLSKIDAGKMELELTRFQLEQVFTHLQHAGEDRAREKGLALQFTRAPDVPSDLLGDPLRLQQILLNFVGNAIKFTAQGSVSVSVHCTEQSAQDCLLLFEVQDTGIGLSEAEAARLFQSFEQADKSTTRRFGGTGLGLAICRQLAHLMGGEVGVRAAPGAGCTFWFQARFALAQARPVAIAQGLDAEQAAAALRGCSVLVVDDNAFNLEVACSLLEDVGVQVQTAMDGAQAIELLRTTRFDCVLMDVQMPVQDGYSAARQIRADSALRDTLLIALTANASAADYALCLQAGMVDVIKKPIEPQLLFATMARWIRGTGAAAENAGSAEPASSAAPPAAPAVQASARDAQFDTHVEWDAQSLHRLMGDNPVVHARLTAKYLLTATDTLAQLQQAVDAQDWRAAAAIGHKLKSSSRSVGALRLGALCEALERAGQAGQALQCQELAHMAQQAFVQLRLRLQAAQAAQTA